MQGAILSFPGSAWERTALEALPPVSAIREAEPRRQLVPRQSLGTRRFCTPVAHALGSPRNRCLYSLLHPTQIVQGFRPPPPILRLCSPVALRPVELGNAQKEA